MPKEFTPSQRAALRRMNLHSRWAPRSRMPRRSRQLVMPSRDSAGLEAWVTAADRYIRRMLVCVELDQRSAETIVSRGAEYSVTVSHPRLWISLTVKVAHPKALVGLIYGRGPEGLSEERGPFYAVFGDATARGGATLAQRMRWLAGADHRSLT